MNITGNTILVTGGTSGIGLGLALRLHSEGNTVIIAGRRRELLDSISTEHPGIHGVELDIADPDSIGRARNALTASHPDLNVLINNAGIMLKENLLDSTSLQAAEDQVAVNLLGTIRMTYAFAPLLAQRPDAAIVNVTSSLAFVPYPATPTYNATKAALHSFTDSLRVQLAGTESGVQVIEVVPPGVKTDLLDQRNNEQALPLDEFLDGLMDLLRADPTATELVVERAKPIRNAVADGTYGTMLESFSRV